MIDPCWSKGKGGRSRCKFGRISYHATIGLESPKSNTHSNHKSQNENRVSKFKLIFVPRKTRQCRFSPHFQRPHWHHLQGFGIIIDIIGNPKQRQFSSNAHHDCFAGRLYDWDEKKRPEMRFKYPNVWRFPWETWNDHGIGVPIVRQTQIYLKGVFIKGYWDFPVASSKPLWLTTSRRLHLKLGGDGWMMLEVSE